jgi:hypothetical protein
MVRIQDYMVGETDSATQNVSQTFDHSNPSCYLVEGMRPNRSQPTTLDIPVSSHTREDNKMVV